MSLLMDALRRAESNKPDNSRPMQPTAGASLSLEPLSAEISANPLPELSSHLAAVDADLASATLSNAAQPIVPPSAAQPDSSPRETVRNAFAAKQSTRPNKPSKNGLWLLLGALCLGVLGIGAYVWYQVSTLGQQSLAMRPAAAPLPQAAMVPPPAVPVMPPSRATSEPLETATGTPTTPKPSTAEGELPHNLPPQTELAGERSPIRLTRSPTPSDPLMLRAHTTLQRGDLELARREYELALRNDPNNVDALLALAAIAQRQGQIADAEQLRQRAVIANPADAAAQAAALSGTTTNVDPQTTESRLKTLLGANPESHSLNFALGNLYARQGRWSEAQQVYFNAVAADGDNPDYLFNLAVSLDHLRQSRLAAQHYRLALEAAAKRPAAFERSRTEQRIAELQADLPR